MDRGVEFTLATVTGKIIPTVERCLIPPPPSALVTLIIGVTAFIQCLLVFLRMPTRQVIAAAAAAAAALVPLASAGGFPPLHTASFLLKDNGAGCYLSDGRAGQQGHESLEFGIAAGTTPHIRDIVCRGGEHLNSRGYPHKISLRRLDGSALSGPLNKLNAAATRMNRRRFPDVKRLVTFGKPTYSPEYDLRTYPSGSETVVKSVNACRAAAKALEKAYGSLDKLCKEVF